jgi:2-succinyl-5-enolpyruvyl-6-hydroxy-3-cyclohexene-1-carboxylate synthase
MEMKGLKSTVRARRSSARSSPAHRRTRSPARTTDRIADPSCTATSTPAYADDPRWAGIADFVDELVRSGVGDACVSPGSRSTPLAFLLAAQPGLRVWSHVDERSGAFFALGAAKAVRRPVVVLCTSGTAAANFLPAVVEAAYAHVPLIVLTADRPPELRECGAGQAIDQLKLYGGHAKWFAEVGGADCGRRYFRTLACRAVATAAATPAGPVHLNFPLREPLLPAPSPALDGDDVEPRAASVPYTRFHAAEQTPSTSTVAELAALLAAAPRGLIACGPADTRAETAAAIAALARDLGYPILADPTSQMRSGGHDTAQVIDTYDALLRSETTVERVAPELVLRFGPMLTCKPFAAFIRRHPAARQVVIDPLDPWNDPLHLAADIVRAHPRVLCDAVRELLPSLAPRRGGAWLGAWTAANRRARRAVAAEVASAGELFEGQVFAALAEALPDGANLYIGNSLPVRDLELFWPAGPRRVRVLSNRGANGIDGFVSSGLGAAAVSAAPTVVVSGDLGFYHDLNGLLAVRRHALRATFVVLNNDGGGIFSHLPQAELESPGSAFTELFRTPHGLDFRGAVEMYGCRHRRVGSRAELRGALLEALPAPVATVIEVPIDGARSLALHRRLWERAGEAAGEA